MVTFVCLLRCPLNRAGTFGVTSTRLSRSLGGVVRPGPFPVPEALSACGRGHQWEMALALLKQMGAVQVTSDRSGRVPWCGDGKAYGMKEPVQVFERIGVSVVVVKSSLVFHVTLRNEYTVFEMDLGASGRGHSSWVEGSHFKSSRRVERTTFFSITTCFLRACSSCRPEC